MSSARDRILDAALGLIGERGLQAVTHRDVAAAAGVSPGATTYHFADKTALLAAALERFTAEEVARSRAALQAAAAASEAVPDPEDVLDAVTAQLQVTMARRQEQAAQLELYLQAGRDPRLAAAARACLDAYREVAELTLRTAGWTPADAARLAPAALALIDGLVLHELAAPSGDFTRLRLQPALRALLALPDPLLVRRHDREPNAADGASNHSRS